MCGLCSKESEPGRSFAKKRIAAERSTEGVCASAAFSYFSSSMAALRAMMGYMISGGNLGSR